MHDEESVPDLGPCSVLLHASESAGYQILQSKELPARAAKYLPAPPDLDRRLHNLLTSRYPAGLYSHQAEAVQAGLTGRDVCLATSTASGKSLAFMSLAADIVLREDSARVLALYPAKALIQDQREKWGEMLTPLGIRFSFIDGTVPPESRPGILRRVCAVPCFERSFERAPFRPR